MVSPKNRYTALIEAIFFKHYKKGAKSVSFVREDLELAAQQLGIRLPKNLGDVIYSFRYRAALPESITQLAPENLEWVIRPVGQSQYAFSLSSVPRFLPNPMLSETKILDATPGVIERYAFNDEQGLLTCLRYNRLIDIFTGITCYSLQNHLRTTVPGVGQIETDEIYIGIDKQGTHYIIPVQAKGGRDQLGAVQIEQDHAMCLHKFPQLVCFPIAAQFMDDRVIALFAFDVSLAGLTIRDEKHYRLVESHQLTEDELASYRQMSQR